MSRRPIVAQTQEMRVSRLEAFAWIILLGLLVWVIGLFPTWRLSGMPGLAAQAIAAVIVMVATCSSAMIIIRLARSGPKHAAVGMLLSGFVRLILVVGAILIVRWSIDVPLMTLLIWTGLFYIAMFGGEVIWLTRTLSHDNFLVALGDIKRDDEG